MSCWVMHMQVYTSTFVNLHYGTFLQGEGGDKPLTKYKLVCLGPSQRVVGLHAIGTRRISFHFVCYVAVSHHSPLHLSLPHSPAPQAWAPTRCCRDSGWP